MIRTKEELLDTVKSRLGEDAGDDALALIEDLTDTIDSLEALTKDSVDWKKKYEENDQEWRKKYRDRFFNATDEKDDSGVDDQPPKKLTFEDLFKEN